ncbi:histidine phosphatase family protein [Streptomyces sp. URMC 124]|uniref:histidine phosphatase family protein n=1 Tax=Streptomyces sp. URMC 124 TaxID=3423405 RepID=UPI003F19C94F
MTDFLLVRHGETEWHAENRYAGRSDVSLTERGLRQGEALASWAAAGQELGAGQEFDAVMCSPLSRARLTARPAAAALGLPLRVDERLTEVDFGRGEGLTRGEMAEAFPGELAAFLDDPVAHHLPGGEDPAAAAARAVACLTETARDLPGGRVLVVAHSTLLRLALCELLGIPLSRYRVVFPALENGSLTELRLREGRASLLRLNVPVTAADTSHV